MQQEKNRKLSEKEQRRLAAFEATCEQYLQQGYKKTDLTIGIVRANLVTLLIAIPVVALGVLLFMWKNSTAAHFPDPQRAILLLVLIVVLIVVHELIHGITWSLFTERHFKDIEFGFMKEYFTPYCTCLVPLSKKHYILGALMSPRPWGSCWDHHCCSGPESSCCCQQVATS